MWRRRWPTAVVVVALLSLVPACLSAPTEDSSLEDTVRVLRHFSTGVSANRGHFPNSAAGRSHGIQRAQHPLRVEVDSPETPDNSREDPFDRDSIEVTFGSRAPSKGSGLSPPFVVVRDDDDDDDDDSFEIDEDDFRFMNLGRRYHPDGVAPTAPRQLFIPRLATIPAAPSPTAPRVTPSLNNPFIIATASSSEEDEDNPYEDDDDDDDLAIFLGKNLLTVKGDDSSEERLELDDALLGKRYNFIDGQGSVRWGYDLVDQYQHQTVNTDGTMKGRFGWTAPNGQEIKVQYVADDGGYRLIESTGIHHSISIPDRKPPSSGGVPLSSVGDSFKVTVPFGGAGVPLPDPGLGSSSFGAGGVPLPDPGTSSSSFGAGGVPLPDPGTSSSSFGAGGVPLPPPARESTSFGAGGVPLPSPSRPGAASSGSRFFGGDGGGVPLPGMAGTGGVPLPRPSGTGAESSGSTFFGDDETVVVGVGGGGGVPLPGMSGAGGVSLSGSERGGVPLPSPSDTGAASSGSAVFGDDETVVVGGGALGGVALPGRAGGDGTSFSSPGAGGVPLPSPTFPGASPSGSSFFGDDETVVVGGAGGGVSLPGMSGTGGVSLSGSETGGVPLPSPSFPGASPSGSSFFGGDETVVIGGGGGVSLPGMSVGGDGAGVGLPGPSDVGVSLSSPGGPVTGGVPLPSPPAPGPGLSGSDFLGDEETIVLGTSGGVGLPGASRPGEFSLTSAIGSGSGGVPLPSPSGPGSSPSGGSFFGDDKTVVFGGGGDGGGVGLPGAAGPGEFSLTSSLGPGSGGVSLPSPSGPGLSPSGGSFFGDDKTVVFGGGGDGGGVGLPGAAGPGEFSLTSSLGPGSGGVPLPSPSGPEVSPSGGSFFGDDKTVDFGGGGGVGLPGAAGPGEFSLTSSVGLGSGGVPLPSPSGPGLSPSGGSFFGDDKAVDFGGGGGGGGVGLPGAVGPGGFSLTGTVGSGSGGVPLPSSSGPESFPSGGSGGVSLSSLPGGEAGGVGLPGSPGQSDVSFSSPGGPGTGGVSLPSPSSPGASPSGSGFSGNDETVAFGDGIGVGLPGAAGPGGISLSSPGDQGSADVFLSSPSGPGGPPLDSSFFGDESVAFGGGGGVGLPGASDAGGFPLSSPGGSETGGVPIPSSSFPETAPSGSSFLGGNEAVDIGRVGGGVGLPGTDEPSGVPPLSPEGPSTTLLDDIKSGFDDSTTGFGSTGPGEGTGGVGVSLPSFGDSVTGFGASSADSGASTTDFGESGVSLPGSSSSDGSEAVGQGFEDSFFGAPGHGGASGSGLGGVSLSASGSSGGGFGASEFGLGPELEVGVSLPGSGFSDSAGAPGFDDSTSNLGASGPGSVASGPGFGGGGVSLPDFSASGVGFGDTTSGFGASGPGGSESGPGFGGGIPLTSFGSSDVAGAGMPDFDGSVTGFGASGAGGSAPGSGSGSGGVSLSDFGASGLGFGGSTSGFGASGAGGSGSAPGFEGGVSLLGSGSSDGAGAGGTGFGDSTSGFGGFGPGFDRGVPLSVIDSSGNVNSGSFGVGGSENQFGSGGIPLSGSGGSFDGSGLASGGFPSGGEFKVSGPVGTGLPGLGRGGLDASEVPLQGPPFPGTFKISTNLGQDGGSSGVPLNIAKDMSFNRLHPTHSSFPFFEVGPPEPVNQAAGGPINASPFPHLQDSTILDSRPPNQFTFPVRSDPQPESSVKSDGELDKPQDLVKVYSEIYGIKMMSEDWAAPGRREAPPANLELPKT